MPLTEIDRQFLKDIRGNVRGAWQRLVDRYLSLVVMVVETIAENWSIALRPQRRDELVTLVFASLRQDRFAVLSQFSGNSNLATYVTVVARRLAGKELAQ